MQEIQWRTGENGASDAGWQNPEDSCFYGEPGNVAPERRFQLARRNAVNEAHANGPR